MLRSQNMGNFDSKRLAMRAWLQQKGAHYGGLMLAVLLTSVTGTVHASKWPPALSHPALDAASALVLRASSPGSCGAVELAVLMGRSVDLHARRFLRPAAVGHCAAEVGDASHTAAEMQRKLAWHSDRGLALSRPNGLLELDASPLLELANNRVTSPVLARVGALGVEASRLADGGCDLGGGRSGLDSVLSSLIVLALAALGMRFRT